MILMVCFVKSQCAINSLLSNFTNFISWHWKSVFCKTLRVYWLHSYYQLYLLALQIYFKKKTKSECILCTYLLTGFIQVPYKFSKYPQLSYFFWILKFRYHFQKLNCEFKGVLPNCAVNPSVFSLSLTKLTTDANWYWEGDNTRKNETAVGVIFTD